MKKIKARAMPPVSQPASGPNKLLNLLVRKLEVKNDAALCRALEVSAPIVSKIRHGKQGVGAALLIRMHEISGMSIRELRAAMGDYAGLFPLGRAAD